jgi:hypothetical protein
MTESDAEVKHDRDRPNGPRSQRKINRNAIRAPLHERGFIGVDVTMHTRDYALVSLDDVPEPRREVAQAYFEWWDAAYREPSPADYEWGVRI